MASATQEIMDNLALYGCPDIPLESDPLMDEHNCGAAANELLSTVFGAFENTPMERYSEDIGWGIVNVFHRARTRLSDRIDEMEVSQRQVLRDQDGSEVLSVELETTTARLRALQEHSELFDDMIDILCEQYSTQTGSAWTPRTGSRRKGRLATSAIIDATQLRKARARMEFEKLNPEGRMIGFAGGPNYQDYDTVFAVLDKIHAKYPDMTLVHGGQRKGAELIAAKWAETRNVTQKVYTPDFDRHKGSAPFKRNDEIIKDGLDALVVFPGEGITKNLMQKAAANGVTVWDRG